MAGIIRSNFVRCLISCAYSHKNNARLFYFILRKITNNAIKRKIVRNYFALLQDMELNSIVTLFIIFLVSANGDLCPKQCECGLHHELYGATCVNQNIIGIYVGVPSNVQLYRLSQNSISELNNFCFKEAGYFSLQVLDLSYNVIHWIGLHAFAELYQLVHLDLSNNRLSSIPSELIWDAPKLISLDLSTNLFEILKNEPFLMHDKLQILKLNKCRIKHLPDRTFTKLTNLKNLDISENYLTTIGVNVLSPLVSLETLELRNYLMNCNAAFTSLETWIASRRIQYRKRCTQNTGKISSSLVPAERKGTKVLTGFEKFDKDFSSVQALIIGIELGLAIGLVGTYVWLSKFFHCDRLNYRPSIRRQIRRVQRMLGNLRTNLLWSNVVSHSANTPPSFHRRAPNPPNVPPSSVPRVIETALQLDAIRPPDRPETPPPSYDECLNIR